jgi:hypothetical protein
MTNSQRILMIALVCAAAALTSSADDQRISATGWFADDACAMARARSGTFTSTNPECALRCLKKGAKLVFVAEQEKTVWPVAQSEDYVGHVGEYVKINGNIDAAGTARIESITILDKVRPSCTVPQRKTAKVKNNAGNARE